MIAFICAALMLALIFTLVATMTAIDRMADRWQKEAAEQHSYCVSAVSGFCSDRLIAQYLRRLADRWDSVDEQPTLLRVAKEQYRAGGPSMPAIWLKHEADRLDPPAPEHDLIDCPHEHTYAGECIR